MARMIPTEPDPDTPASERYVFGRLRDRLPDAWTVLHARRICLPAQEGRPGHEGELDFVLIDPDRGLLALEVNGGGIEKAREGWSQVQGSVQALDRYLREQSWFRQNRTRLPFACGLVLPDVDVRVGLGADLPRDRLIDRGDFAGLRDAIERVFEASGLKPSTLEPAAISATIRALAPTLRLVRSLAHRIDREREQLVRLTAEQARIIDVLEDMPRVAIQGAAGTGKTMLAAEWARRLAEDDKRTLLLCFNRPLAEFLETGAQGYAVSNFHRLCYELCQAADLSFEVPVLGREQRTFWDEEAPLLLLRALESRPAALFDAVVVDEGQDFRKEWWPAVEGLLREPGVGRLVVFFDPNQNLYEGGPAESLEISPAKLNFNCRNTARIARFACAVIGTEAELRPGSPEGADVELIHTKTDEESVDEVRRVLHRLLHDEGLRPDQIVVLSTRSRDRSPLARAGRLGSVTLCPLHAAASAGQIRFGSLHQFKGLEADVVVLTDVAANDPNASPRHIYVGTSRARHLLVVIERVD